MHKRRIAALAVLGFFLCLAATTQIDLTNQVRGTLPHGNGGTDVTSPGSNGNLLTSNGTSWTSAAAPPTPVIDEAVSFSGTSGTLANTPSAVSGYTAVRLYRNGLRQKSGGGNDFTISGASITLTVSAGGSDTFVADYYK
jgi:hypothetical protein